MEIIAGSIGESVELPLEVALVDADAVLLLLFTGFEVEVSGGNEAKSVEFIEEDDDFFSLLLVLLLLFELFDDDDDDS
jgi:hypothetical protein